MKKYTKILAAVMAVAMLTAFTDVPKKHWAYNFVTRAQELKIVQGVDSKHFKPDDIISKQEIAYLIINVYQRSNDISNAVFEECVSSSAIALKQAEISDWAKTNLAFGFVNGYWKVDDFQAPVQGKSGGSAILTRQMMSRWIVNAMGYKTFGLRVIDYADASKIDPAYYPYVDALKKYGIMKGSSDGTFNPAGSMTRAEAAGVAVNMCDENAATYSNIEKNPFIFKSGVVKSVSKQYQSFKLDDAVYQIAPNAKIILDGQVVNFDSFAALENKKATLSLCITGDNVNSVIVQTKPCVVSGVLEGLVNTKVQGTANSNYKIASIRLNGATADYVINADSEVLSSLTIGNSVQFISDGIYILEIK